MGPEIIVFDLNGTLLDLGVLDGHFERIFGSPDCREKWFEQLQILWMTTIVTGTYQPFEKLARAALEMLAAKEARTTRPSRASWANCPRSPMCRRLWANCARVVSGWRR